VTFGAAGNLPDLATWGAYLLPVARFLLAYDADEAGENGASKVMDLMGQRAELALLPDGQHKDITDFHQADGDLWAWISEYLPTWEEIGAADV
jgi:DNA primase